ncbi:hypothetical protein NQ317_000565 [Molorchus minor]|uniref:Uncharacterized protein n=1 Tax=Molorchus minor TaxID=1323400 RepID=A0ABQ9ITQ1_9CUCU|nr:hypothetical protein NQ317_000565 [Molorchus minor]
MEEPKSRKDKPLNKKTDFIKGQVQETKTEEFDSDQRDSGVGEVIDNIKGEMKCLVRVLKTEKLILNVIIGKQFFPRYYRLPSEPGNTTRKACPSAS